MSAIDWLNAPAAPGQSAPIEPQAAKQIAIYPISALPLAASTTVTIGMLDPIALGFAEDFWTDATGSDLPPQPGPALPSLVLLYHQLLLTRAPSAVDLALARSRALYEVGSLNAAWILVQPIMDRAPSYFQLAQDIALLSGRVQELCQTWYGNRELSPHVETRVLCLSLLGDWQAAANVFVAHDTLGDVNAADAALIAAHLEPELADSAVPRDIAPRDMTPFRFWMMESAGFNRPIADLPLPYAFAQLTKDVGWKPRLDAAERLARAGSVTPNQLLGLYTHQVPAASGGVWDRAKSVQRLRASLANGTAAPQVLRMAWLALAGADLAPNAAQLFQDEWAGLDGLTDDPNLQRFAALAGLGTITTRRNQLEPRVFGTLLTLGRPATRKAIAAGLTGVQRSDPTAQDVIEIITTGAAAGEQDLTALTTTLQGLVAIGKRPLAEQLAFEYLILIDSAHDE